MASVRSGNKSILLIVDVQVAVARGAWDAERVIGNVARIVERARAQGVPVIWVQHADDELVDGSADWQWVTQLVRRPDEALVPKHYNSSFEQTSLEDELARHGATHIVLAGMATNWCIRATAYAALERGYDLTLVKDAHTAKSIPLEDGRRIEAESMIADLNIAMTWLSYPGRTTGTGKVEEVEFRG